MLLEAGDITGDVDIMLYRFISSIYENVLG